MCISKKFNIKKIIVLQCRYKVEELLQLFEEEAGSKQDEVVVTGVTLEDFKEANVEETGETDETNETDEVDETDSKRVFVIGGVAVPTALATTAATTAAPTPQELCKVYCGFKRDGSYQKNCGDFTTDPKKNLLGENKALLAYIYLY